LKKNTKERFLHQITDSQGIIHKVCGMYCEDREHRKDLFQEILIQLWKSYPTFRGEAKFSTWVYRVAINVAIQDFRKFKKQQKLFFQTNEFRDRSQEDNDTRTDEHLVQMHRAIGNLNKIEKAIIMLHLDDKTNAEIASIIGITQNYVRVKMNRIKTKLKRSLNT